MRFSGYMSTGSEDESFELDTHKHTDTHIQTHTDRHTYTQTHTDIQTDRHAKSQQDATVILLPTPKK